MGVELALSMKRMQLKREAVQAQLRNYGFPAVMDNTHIIFTGGIESIAQWSLLGIDRELRSIFGGGEHMESAMLAFEASMPAISIEIKASPGISFRGMNPTLDGVCMTMRFATKDANTGPLAYIVPVTQLVQGAEWTEHVALVPKSHLSSWMKIKEAAMAADLSMSLAGLVLRCFNGPDQAIQPMSLDDIIMDPSAKGSFVDDITGFLSRRTWYESRRLSWTRKILLEGPPGTGKTSLARWAATELGLPAFTFDFANSWSDSADFVRFMSYAQRRGPSLIILDDFEKIMAGENRSGVTAHTILTSFSGMGSTDGIIIIGTCNSKEPFRGPMMRRWDVSYHIGLPEIEYRQEYLQKILSMEGIDPTSIANAATATAGWSFDDLRTAVTSAANFMVGRNGDSIDEGDLARGINIIAKRRLEDTQNADHGIGDKKKKKPFTSMKASGATGMTNNHNHSYDNTKTNTGETDDHTHGVQPGSTRTDESGLHTHSIPANIRRSE